MEEDSGKSQVNFNQGEALLRIAATYPTIFEVVMEGIQNAIDVNATRIDIFWDRQRRAITITDNGDGVSREDFERALGSVCSSVKQQGKLGRYGIGLISPLGKCESFTFTSCPRTTTIGYTEWRFVSNDIRNQADRIVVPHTPRPNYQYSRQKSGNGKKNNVPWRTKISIQGYTQDRIIARLKDMNALADGILDRYSAAMRRHDVKVSIRLINDDGTEEKREEISAKKFAGKRLDEVKSSDNDAGDIVFRLFLARKTTKGFAGKVLVGELRDDFRFGFDLFCRNASEYLSNEVMQALRSGIFEGEILASRIKLHPNRRSFEQNEAFVGFCIAIDSWYAAHGKQHMKQVQEARSDQRYQDLGLRSLQTIAEMLKNPAFAAVANVLNTFSQGSVGEGHTKPARSEQTGIQKDGSVSTSGGKRSGASADTSVSRDRAEPVQEKKGHNPFTVAGPKGDRRTMVRSGSMGLQFSHIAMEGSDKLWELDVNHGILHFNIRHPLWVSCEDSDRQVMQLQELIAIQALTLHGMPEDWQETSRIALDEVLNPFVFLIKNSMSYSPTARLKKKDVEE